MKVANVNTTSIEDAVTLGCRTMSRIFNADDNDIPFFTTYVRPDVFFAFHRVHSEAHVPGRHLNALLSAENALGIRIEDDVIEKHERAARFSYSGPVPLPLNRDVIDGPPVNFMPHNIREGFHALYALIAYRNSSWAHEMAESGISAIFKLWDAETGWDQQKIEEIHGLKLWDSTFIPGIARAIGPLVKYHQLTRSAPALNLAIALKDEALNKYFLDSGEYDAELLGGHTHSVTSVLSSLAQLADLTCDAVLMGRVKAFYDNGLRQIRNELGWSPENEATLNRGEANNTGDILETALILGRWGYTEYYHDAERILRGHLLPCQLRDVSFIQDPPNPDGEDGRRDVAQRHLGAFGFPAPYGHEASDADFVSFNMDIVGGVVGSLCEAFREVVRSDSGVHRVNLLFDHETEDVKVQSPYTHGALRIEVKHPAPVMVRIPPWVQLDDIRLEGAAALPRLVNGYLYIPEPPRAPFTVNFPLKEEELVLKYRTRHIRTRMRGDEVHSMENFGMDLTFFDPI